MRFGFRARFQTEWAIDKVRLLLVQDRGDGRTDVWLGGDTWQTVEQGVMFTDEMGVLLPTEAVRAIAEAAAENLGNELPSTAEVKVLREWLAKEQARVDEKWRSA